MGQFWQFLIYYLFVNLSKYACVLTGYNVFIQAIQYHSYTMYSYVL